MTLTHNDTSVGEMFTQTGLRVKPLDMNPDDINIEDLASALSKICRYGGHTQKFYSVAEHCVRVTDYVSYENKKWALLHDASEAYLGDVPAPLKYHPDFAFYKIAEKNLMDAVVERFNLDPEEPEEVSFWDKEIRRYEMASFTNIPYEFHNLIVDTFTKINPWSPDIARVQFLKTAAFLKLA